MAKIQLKSCSEMGVPVLRPPEVLSRVYMPLVLYMYIASLHVHIEKCTKLPLK